MLARSFFITLLCLFSPSATFAAPTHDTPNTGLTSGTRTSGPVSKRLFGSGYQRVSEPKKVEPKKVEFDPAEFKFDIDKDKLPLLRSKDVKDADIPQFVTFLGDFNTLLGGNGLKRSEANLLAGLSADKKTEIRKKVDYIIYCWDKLSRTKKTKVELDLIEKLWHYHKVIEASIRNLPDEKPVHKTFTKAGIDSNIPLIKEMMKLELPDRIGDPRMGQLSFRMDWDSAAQVKSRAERLLREVIKQFNKVSDEKVPESLGLTNDLESMTDKLYRLVKPEHVDQVRTLWDTAMLETSSAINFWARKFGYRPLKHKTIESA